MTFTTRSYRLSQYYQRGFSLIELVTVIILLGILSVALAPRFTGSAGFTEFALQKRALSTLRNLQLKAMYDTRPDFCYKLIVDASATPAFGPSTLSYLPSQANASCGDFIDRTSDSVLHTEANEMLEANIRLVASDGASAVSFIAFDSLGRASTSAGTCAQRCLLDFIGESTATICIESEGYVHAC